jgi:hypothetical protein
VAVVGALNDMNVQRHIHLPFGNLAIHAPQAFLDRLSDYIVLRHQSRRASRLFDIFVEEVECEAVTNFDAKPERALAHVDFAYLKGTSGGHSYFVPENKQSKHRISADQSTYVFETWNASPRSQMEFVRFVREVVRGACLRQGFSCYHASSVSFLSGDGQRRSVAFIGQSGAGKTTFMSKALEALPQASFIANDRILTGKVDGTTYVVPITLSVRLIADDAEFEKLCALGDALGSSPRRERGKAQISPRLFCAYADCEMEEFSEDLRVVLPRNRKMDKSLGFSAANILSDQSRSYQDPAFPDRWLMDGGEEINGYCISPSSAIVVPWAYSERNEIGERLISLLEGAA